MTRASRIGAETYTATLRRLVWSLAVQFMKAEASAHTTMSARSTLAGRPLRARPSASTEKMIMATSRARAWIMDATFWCLTREDEPVLRREHDVQQATVQQGQQGHTGRDQHRAGLAVGTGQAPDVGHQGRPIPGAHAEQAGAAWHAVGRHRQVSRLVGERVPARSSSVGAGGGPG